jgi:hypothetical protein
MKTSLLILSSVLLTGCAAPFQVVADYYDNRDMCQYKGKEEGYKLPNFCGKNRGYSIVTTVPDGNGNFRSRVVNY